ncbi:MAG: glycine cleavage system aminomethyltransferase GcvT [Candidatus Omnitrophica bacterium]|nr:glycine cleavage system aminomethyltransferase GcvT [Candidatus Omnitrophota bacterium]
MQTLAGKKTPLYDIHQKLGARIVNFGGWLLPVQYTGIVQEHQATRQSAGLFDVSHLGQVDIEGEEAEKFLEELLPADISALADGQIQHTLFCQENGGIIDDLLVYRHQKNSYLLVINGAFIEDDIRWILKHAASHRVQITDKSDVTFMIAVQGPRAAELLNSLVSTPLEEIGYYHFLREEIKGIPVLLSHTGYTGEDGFEIMGDFRQAAAIWEILMKTGGSEITPAGLGARDTLRLEAWYLLSGQDFDKEHTPIEAGLGWTYSLTKPQNYIGRNVLLEQKQKGASRRIVGFEMIADGIARHGYPIFKNGQKIGEVTSGAPGPSVGKAIGLGYVPAPHAGVGNEIEIAIHGKKRKARIVQRPFYRGGLYVAKRRHS